MLTHHATGLAKTEIHSFNYNICIINKYQTGSLITEFGGLRTKNVVTLLSKSLP